MKFGINAQVIIALLGALYILMVCREKYRIEYAEGEAPVKEEKKEKKDKGKEKGEKRKAEPPSEPVKEKKEKKAKKEEDMIEGQAMIEEEGMSTGAIVGITAVSIVALIAIMIMMRRLRR